MRIILVIAVSILALIGAMGLIEAWSSTGRYDLTAGRELLALKAMSRQIDVYGGAIILLLAIIAGALLCNVPKGFPASWQNKGPSTQEEGADETGSV